VGPYTVIEEGVVIGPHCKLGPHVHLSGNTVIGSGNIVHPGAVLGNVPQDLKYRGAPSRVRIGDRNTFRENVTINRATDETEDTVIGSGNLLMAGVHVAHNTRLGDHCIIANGTLLGGHVVVGDRAVISGNCAVHQFVRIGTFSMMQGLAAVSKDLPPYTVARGINGICGLNVVGLRRGGFTSEQRLELKRLYRLLFRSGLGLQAAIARARSEFQTECARALIEFVAEAKKRGVCRDAGRSMRDTHSVEPAEED
jgi:UDP-N-acetylglucosamine acyltransferase